MNRYVEPENGRVELPEYTEHRPGGIDNGNADAGIAADRLANPGAGDIRDRGRIAKDLRHLGSGNSHTGNDREPAAHLPADAVKYRGNEIARRRGDRSRARTGQAAERDLRHGPADC